MIWDQSKQTLPQWAWGVCTSYPLETRAPKLCASLSPRCEHGTWWQQWDHFTSLGYPKNINKVYGITMWQSKRRVNCNRIWCLHPLVELAGRRRILNHEIPRQGCLERKMQRYGHKRYMYKVLRLYITEAGEDSKSSFWKKIFLYTAICHCLTGSIWIFSRRATI